MKICRSSHYRYSRIARRGVLYSQSAFGHMKSAAYDRFGGCFKNNFPAGLLSVRSFKGESLLGCFLFARNIERKM